MNFSDFEILTHPLILARRPDFGIATTTTTKKQNKTKEIKKNNKQTYHIVDCAVPADHIVKMKENEKSNKYWTLRKN